VNFVSASTLHTTSAGATVEVGTVTHNGRSYSAMGSMVDTSRGIVVGYVHDRGQARTPRYTLTTWEGGHIADLSLTGAWMGRTPRGDRVRMYGWAATIGGRVYSGRNSGAAMVVRLKAGRILEVPPGVVPADLGAALSKASGVAAPLVQALHERGKRVVS
jgi:hypothetical protein